jgi:hypothetical protein
MVLGGKYRTRWGFIYLLVSSVNVVVAAESE